MRSGRPYIYTYLYEDLARCAGLKLAPSSLSLPLPLPLPLPLSRDFSSRLEQPSALGLFPPCVAQNGKHISVIPFSKLQTYLSAIPFSKLQISFQLHAPCLHLPRPGPGWQMGWHWLLN